MADLGTIVAEIAAEMADAPDRGAVATYIPPLAEVDPAKAAAIENVEKQKENRHSEESAGAELLD